MDAYEELDTLGSDLTRRIALAEFSGCQPLVDVLLELKLRNNRKKAQYVVISTGFGKGITKQPGM